MHFSGEEIEQLRPRIRFKVSYEVGFLCPDIDDIVQETLTRFFVAIKDDKVRNTASPGAFLNGICRNVISEYRRRSMRDEPMPEILPEPPGKAIPEAELFEMQRSDRSRHGAAITAGSPDSARLLSRRKIEGRDSEGNGDDGRELPRGTVPGQGEISQYLRGADETSGHLMSLNVMGVDFHSDPVFREQLIAKYLYRRLSANLVEELENHYLECQECFEEMRATELLIRGLSEPILERKQMNDVTVIRFTGSSQLLAASLELTELTKAIRLENDTKVLLDLSKVSRIDSTGLGVLMNCYCHAVKNSGALKLLHPDASVKRVLSVTRIDSFCNRSKTRMPRSRVSIPRARQNLSASGILPPLRSCDQHRIAFRHD